MTRSDNAFDAAFEAAEYLKNITEAPAVAVVLGSGLGALADTLVDAVRIDYSDIPHFPGVAVSGHAGQLVVGNLPNGGARIAALAGRVHLYEGHPIDHVVHPTRTLRLWGVKAALMTNAAGGINPEFDAGDLMLITDHLNLTGMNPLRGPNDARLGPRFPDMTEAYDHELADALRAAAKEEGVTLREGVYAGLVGPSYETPAEVQMLKAYGSDAVGMSTVLEVIAARHMGLKITGISCITNLASGLSGQPLSHSEVEEVAKMSRAAFQSLVARALTHISGRLTA